MKLTRCLFLLSVLFNVSRATITTGELEWTNDDFVFFGRHCFPASGGILSVRFDFDDNSGNDIILAFYTDFGGTNEFESVWNGAESCSDKLSRAQATLNLNLVDGVEIRYSVTGTRPRWWFMVVTNCNAARYKVNYYNFTAIQATDTVFTHHAGADEQGMMETSIAFFIILLVLLVVLIWAKVKAKRIGFQFEILKLLIFSTVFCWVGVMFVMLHWAVFLSNGEGAISLSWFGRYLVAIGTVIMNYIVIMIGKGWTIATNSTPGRRLVLIVFFVYSVLVTGMFYYAVELIEPYEIIYEYQNVPGYVLCIFNFALMIWFIHCIFTTLKRTRNNDITSFYWVFGFVGLAWFGLLPVLVFAATSMEDYERAHIMYTISLSVLTLALVLFLCIFAPYRKNCFVTVLDPLSTPGFGGMEIHPGNFALIADDSEDHLWTPPLGRV